MERKSSSFNENERLNALKPSFSSQNDNLSFSGLKNTTERLLVKVSSYKTGAEFSESKFHIILT